MRILAALALVFLVAAPTSAQSIDATVSRLDWAPDSRVVADAVSTGLVVSALALPCLESRSVQCLKTSALRYGLTVGLAETTKRLVHRTRPDGSDRLSFFSEHTALACVGGFSSKREMLGTALCVSAAYLRIAARKHWLSDVAIGAGVGFGFSRLAQ